MAEGLLLDDLRSQEASCEPKLDAGSKIVRLLFLENNIELAGIP
jgi:hypothetical protein